MSAKSKKKKLSYSQKIIVQCKVCWDHKEQIQFRSSIEDLANKHIPLMNKQRNKATGKLRYPHKVMPQDIKASQMQPFVNYYPIQDGKVITKSENLFNNRFLVERKLAGDIYYAIDLLDDKKVTIVRTRHGDKYQILKYLSKQLDVDTGLCRIINEWKTDKCFYYAKQYCDKELFGFVSDSFKNGTMYNYMAKESKKQQIVRDNNDICPWLKQIQNIFAQCVECVYWMHTKGICHMDLSLENTMLIKDNGLKVKIICFDLAKKCTVNQKDFNFMANGRIGKRGYMAPEVYGKKRYDCRKAEVWCLGVMLFMMCIGAPPYKRPTRHDAAFNYIINGMLKDVLKHWKRLRLINKDALDCMEKIFQWEKRRITMEQLIAHPFVGVAQMQRQKAKKIINGYFRETREILSLSSNLIIPSFIKEICVDYYNIFRGS